MLVCAYPASLPLYALYMALSVHRGLADDIPFAEHQAAATKPLQPRQVHMHHAT